MPVTITVRRKGQITLPLEIRDQLDLDQGDRLIVDVIEDKIVMTRPEDIVERTAGIFAEYAKNGPVVIDRDAIWGEIAAERDNRIKQQVAEEAETYDPDR